jgi:hypothetical protein
METVTYLSMVELETGMEVIRQAPKDFGMLRMIVRRPQEDGRETVQEAELSLTEGLVGDNWKLRGNRHMPDGSANPQTQITIMNARSAALVAQSEDRWPLALGEVCLGWLRLVPRPPCPQATHARWAG